METILIRLLIGLFWTAFGIGGAILSCMFPTTTFIIVSLLFCYLVGWALTT